MTSRFWINVSTLLQKLDKTQIWLAVEFYVGKTVINSGIARKSSPSAENAFAIARVLELSIEELLEGDAGAEYVRKIVRNDPREVQVPERIFPIVEELLLLDDRDLSGILANVQALNKDKKGKQQRRKPKTAIEIAG
jgi:hypothetical protein